MLKVRLCIGYSGGLDSQVLLHLLAQTRELLPEITIEAIHVHHGLHPEANEWVRHCETSCAALSIPLTVIRVNPRDYPDLSPEAAARAARYAAFQTHFDDAGKAEKTVLVLAHHLDDQLETMLHRLCRGTGVLGLAGMSVWTEPSSVLSAKIFRPFLAMGLDKTSLEQLAKTMQLSWIEDSSNADLRFDRNFIRQEIVPRLKSRWPEVATAANRTAALCREITQATAKSAKNGLAAVQYDPNTATLDEKAISLEEKWDKVAITTSLSVKKMLAFASKERRDILRVWLQEKGLYVPGFEQLARLEREVLAAASGRKPRLKIGDYVIARWRDRLFVYKAEGALV